MLKHELFGDVLQTTEITHSINAIRTSVFSLNIKNGYRWDGYHDDKRRIGYQRTEESALKYKGKHHLKHVNATLYVTEGMAVRSQTAGKPSRYYIKKCDVWSRVSAADFEKLELELISYNTHNTTKRGVLRKYFAMYQVHVKRA